MMAAATNPETGERREGLTSDLVTYYRSEGWLVEDDVADEAVFPQFPGVEDVQQSVVGADGEVTTEPLHPEPVADDTVDESDDDPPEVDDVQPVAARSGSSPRPAYVGNAAPPTPADGLADPAKPS